jgi:uncharacterized protein YyaL (SSP411 family)
VAEEAGLAPDKVHALLTSAAAKLLLRRERRNLPRDDKQLAAWNGLMLSALSEAAERLAQPRYRAAAQALRDFLVQRLWDGQHLVRAKSGARVVGTAGLEDYAYVARGVASWSEVSGNQADRDLAGRLVRDAWQRFFRENGWQPSDESLLPGQPRQPVASDGPLPSAPAVVIDLSRRLGLVTEDKGIASQVQRALALSYQPTVQDPVWHASHAQALLLHQLL